MRWRIVDAIKAIYEADNLHRSIKETVLNSMRGEIGSRELDNVLSARQAISESILANITPTLSRWGIQLTSVELQEVKTDDATADAMRQQLEAERKSRAIGAQAKGEAEAILAKANAEKDASILKAQGLNESLKILAEAEKAYLEQISSSVGKEEAAKILMTQNTIDGFAIISSKQGDEVYIPPKVGGFITFGEK